MSLLVFHALHLHESAMVRRLQRSGGSLAPCRARKGIGTRTRNAHQSLLRSFKVLLQRQGRGCTARTALTRKPIASSSDSSVL
jgi:hypothetical protein